MFSVRISGVFLVLSAFCLGDAVGASIDRVEVAGKVLQVPLRRLPPELTSYAPRLFAGDLPIIRVKGGSALGGFIQAERRDAEGRVLTEDMRESYVSDFLVLHGYDLVDDTAGEGSEAEGPDLLLELHIGRPDLSQGVAKGDRKVLDGTERTSYYLQMLLELPAEAVLRRASDGAEFLREQVGVKKTIEFKVPGQVLVTEAVAWEAFRADRLNFELKQLSNELKGIFVRTARTVNSAYGWLVYDMPVELFEITDSKSDLSDLEEGLSLARSGFEAIGRDPRGEDGHESLGQAIEIWEKALAEADFENRRARIDEKVARHLQYNVGTVAIWARRFDLAAERLGQAGERRSLRGESNAMMRHLGHMRSRHEQHVAAFAGLPDDPAPVPAGVGEAADVVAAALAGDLERVFREKVGDWEVEGMRNAAGKSVALISTRFQTEGGEQPSQGRLAYLLQDGGQTVELCFSHRDRGWSDVVAVAGRLEVHVNFVGDFALKASPEGMYACAAGDAAGDVLGKMLKGWNEGDVSVAAFAGDEEFSAYESVRGFPLAVLMARMLVRGERPADPRILVDSPQYKALVD